MLGDGSRMNREAHVRFCEGPQVKFPQPPPQCALAWSVFWRTLMDSKKAVSPMRKAEMKKPAEAGF